MRPLFPVLFFAYILAACSSSDDEQTGSKSAPDIVGEEISYATDELTMNGYLAYDDSREGDCPGILVIHEWWGHNDYARARADSLAKLGYVALAVDMYGEGKKAAHPEDAQKFSGQVMSNFESAKERFRKAMETLQNHPMVNPEQIGAVGYCFGGSVAIAMANAGLALDGVVAFHAGLQVPVMPQEGITTSPILVINGADDPFITNEQEQKMSAAMDSAGVDFTYITYEGIRHSFTNPSATAKGKEFGLPLEYNAEADQKSWETMKQFFEETFSGE